MTGRGHFVVFEGPEGAGKSTQMKRLVSRLAQLGHQPLVTREPGGTRAGEAMRDVLLDPDLHIVPLAEFLLYSAARAQHVAEVIAPALITGRDVISDRFTGASVAYQGHGRQLDLELVEQLNLQASEGVAPDLTVLLDLPAEVGLQRAAARSKRDRLEAAGSEFHGRVRNGYLAQAAAQPNWVVVDAMQDEETVAAAVWRAVAGLLAPAENKP